MRAVYIDKYNMKNSHNCVFASISLPILERKTIKQELKSIDVKMMNFDFIDYSNLKNYYNYCNLFMKNISMRSNVKRINNYKRSMYCRTLMQLIEMEYVACNKEEMRIYIPFESDKTHLRTLNNMLKKRKINAYVEEIRYKESKFSQLANIISGIVYYHDKDDLYGKNLGKKGKPQLVAYLYSCKKTKNKLNIL